MNQSIISSISLLVICAAFIQSTGAVQDEDISGANKTMSKERKLFSYAGSFLPSDWQVVSILNERAVIGFTNGSARNSLVSELDPRDRSFLERLQNGTIYTTPLTTAKQKLTEWSSSVSSTVSKFGKSVKDQFDSFLNNRDQKAKENQMLNLTETLN